MSALKHRVIEMIRRLPDDCSLEDIQYHLYVRAKAERGLRDVEAGETLSQEDVEEEVSRWFESGGQEPH